MKEINLFRDNTGHWLTNKSLLESLLSLETDKCDVLYVHSALSMGIPNPNLKKNDLLLEIYNVLKLLEVPTLCMPTYTFSYCNGQYYDPANSKTKMGALNEFFRKQEGVLRSNDPLMSVAVLGKDKDLALGISTHSITDNSTFDLLHHRSGVKFMFLGTKIGECFTYMHYLEWLYGVDYRYNRYFLGTSILNGKEVTNEYDLFVRYKGVTPNANTFVYEQNMYEKGLAKIKKVGDSSISVVDKNFASIAYRECLLKNPYYFVDFDGGLFRKDRTFQPECEVLTL